MSCPRRDELLAVGALDDPERAAHVRGCDDCRARLAHLEHTLGTLRSAEVGLDAAARARVWREVEAARAPARGLRWPWLIAVPATAAVLTLALLTHLPRSTEGDEATPTVVAGTLRPTTGSAVEAGPLPRDVWLDAPQALVLRMASAQLTAEPGARLSLTSGPDDGLRWARGRVSVVAGARVLELITPAARVRAADATYTLEASEARVVVEVHAGVVELSQGRVLTTVRAGERAVVEAPATTPAPAHEASAVAAPASAEAPGAPPSAVEDPRPSDRPTPHDAAPAATRSPEACAPGPSDTPLPRARDASPADHRAPTPRPAAASAASALADARHFLGRDDRRAAALADAVVARAPESVEALLVAGDARRRQGLWLEAEQLYSRAVVHPDGAPFLEEASLRRAEAQAARGELVAALASLSAARAARTDFLGPERVALEARLHLERGDDERAYAALLRLADSTDRVLDTPRLQLARRSVSHDRARAAELLTTLVARGGAVAREARAILDTDDTTATPAPGTPR